MHHLLGGVPRTGMHPLVEQRLHQLLVLTRLHQSFADPNHLLTFRRAVAVPMASIQSPLGGRGDPPPLAAEDVAIW